MIFVVQQKHAFYVDNMHTPTLLSYFWTYNMFAVRFMSLRSRNPLAGWVKG